MKKFKNKLAVKGSKSLLKAFEEELLNLGYINDEKWNETWRQEKSSNFILTNIADYSDNKYSYYNHKGSSDYVLSLPQDWNHALELASEVIEEIPEYVECIKDYSDQFTKGKIYQVDLKYSNSSRYSFIKDDKGHTNGWDAVNFKPSTKEAFDKQNQFKEGDWLYHKNDWCEAILRFKSVNGIKVATDEYYQFRLSNDNLEGEGYSDYYTQVDKVRLATDEEIKRILLKVAEIKYPIGTKFKSAYDDTPDGISNGIFKISNKDIVKQSGQTINNSYRYVYYKSKWAEIVEDPKLVINGHEVVRISSNQVKIGCQKFYVDTIEEMRTLLNNYGGTYVFKDNTKWTVDDLNKILSVFDN